MSDPFLPGRRKLLLGGLGLAASAVGLSGCGSIPTAGGASAPTSGEPSSSSAGSASANPGTGGSDDAGGKVTISFLAAMSSAPQRAALAKITKDFMAANPDIVVDLQEQPDDSSLHTTISRQIAAGRPPTIAEVQEDWAAEYAASKVIVPLDAYIAKAQQYEDFYDGIKADLQLPDQKSWMWPFSASVAVLYYNADLVPEPPKTWDEFARVATSVSKGDVVGLTIDPGSSAAPGGGTALLEILAQAFGDPVFTPDGTPQFTKPSAIKALQYLVNLKKARALTLGKNDPGQAALARRTGAFDISSVADYPDILKAVGQKVRLGVAQLPTGPGGMAANQLLGRNIVLFEAADHDQKAAAWKYMQFLTQPAQQAYWSVRTGYLPVCQQATLQKSFKNHAATAPFLAVATQQLNTATPLPPVKWVGDCSGYLAVAIQQAVGQGKDPAAALRAAQASAEKAKLDGPP